MGSRLQNPVDGNGSMSEGIARDAIERAIDVYLGCAYPDGPPPTAVLRRLAWREEPGPPPLEGPPFEQSPGGLDRAPTFALRLGNACYPHMKLQIQAWNIPEGFLLSVNCHDQVAAPPADSPDLEPFRALQAANQGYKGRIEAAWDDAGLPTFHAYLRSYLAAEGGADLG